MGVTHKQSGRHIFSSVKAESLTAKEVELNDLVVNKVTMSTGATPKIAVVEIPSAIQGSATAQETAFTLPDKAIVYDVFVDVTTEETTGTGQTIDVGVVGTTNGYLDGVDVSSTGLIKGTLAYNAVTLGSLLTTNTGDGTNPVKEPDITSGDTTVTVTASNDDFAELEGNVIIVYTEID